MIKIRYRDADELSPGLHAAAEDDGRNTTVFLLPGLTAAERRSALRRLRLSARMGYCPPLPAAQLAVALVADRVRTTVGQVGTLIRSHPAGSTVPVMVLSAGAIAFLALSAVSIQVLHIPRDPGRSGALVITAGGRHNRIPSPAPPQAQPTADPDSQAPADPDLKTSSPASPAAASSPHSAPPASSSSPSSPSPSATPSTGISNPAPSPMAAPTTATPSPTIPGPAVMQVPPTPGPSSTCLDVGPVGLCP